MFSEFQNMFDKLKTTVNNVKNQVQGQEEDYANTPQKYNISGRQIQQIKLLSQGAFGFIWLAEDSKTKQQFALKRVICMTEQRLRQAKQEREIMSLLPKSKYLVQYFGGDIVNRNGQKVVITLMELCNGGNLFDMLEKKQNTGFSQQQLIRITLEVLYGLQAIHSTGYCHRDIKIENVLIGNDKLHKLCDFGSSTKKIYNFAQVNQREYDHVKEEIEAMTTPMYRPPQIVDPYLKYKVDQKVDIWMLGCVIYTLSYFKHPFVDSNAIGISTGTYRFPQYPAETPYKVSDKIKDLIRHLLTPNPTIRPSTQQLINLLKNWNSLNTVPLNVQAQRRKKQELAKEKELESLNKKCVDYDGDIPLQKLMELQKKVKNPNIQQKSTFINKKGTQKLKDQNSYNTFAPNNLKTNIPVNNQPTKNVFNSTNPFNTTNNSVPIKKQTKFDDLWGNNFGPQNNKSKTNSQPFPPVQNNSSQKNSFDFFNDFGSTNKNTIPKQPNQSSGVNFQEMFAQTPTQKVHTIKVSEKGIQKSNQQNLLDI